MAHTPGPWIVTKEGIETEGCDVVLLIVRVGHPSIKTPNTDDLRLIAAAPDLLAACKLALNAFERNDAIDWNVLSDAIAKAEGR